MQEEVGKQQNRATARKQQRCRPGLSIRLTSGPKHLGALVHIFGRLTRALLHAIRNNLDLVSDAITQRVCSVLVTNPFLGARIFSKPIAR